MPLYECELYIHYYINDRACAMPASDKAVYKKTEHAAMLLELA